MLSRLILVCSGATDALRKARFPQDEPLEAKALVLAQGMAGRLPRVEDVLCAPERRAAETAAALGLTATRAEALRDQSCGSWAGQSLGEVGASDPAALMAWVTDPSAAPPDGESLQDVALRLGPFLEDRRTRRGTALAVTHPAVIRVAVTLALGAPLEAAGKIDVGPLTLTELTSDGHRWHLRALGVPGEGGLT